MSKGWYRMTANAPCQRKYDGTRCVKLGPHDMHEVRGEQCIIEFGDDLADNEDEIDTPPVVPDYCPVCNAEVDYAKSVLVRYDKVAARIALVACNRCVARRV